MTPIRSNLTQQVAEKTDPMNDLSNRMDRISFIKFHLE